MANKTHKEILDGIVTWLKANFTFTDTGMTAANVQKLPPLSGKDDYKNFPSFLFPCMGPAMTGLNYDDRSLGTLNPIMTVQIIFTAKSSGVVITDLTKQLYAVTQQLQTRALAAARGTRFDMESDIISIDVQSLYVFPTFYTQIEGDRKAFSIGYLTMDLSLKAV
jgi:hypothetical protein